MTNEEIVEAKEKKMDIICVGFTADSFSPEEWEMFSGQVKKYYVEFTRLANPRIYFWKERYKKMTNGVIDSCTNDYSEFIRDYMMQICGMINEARLKKSQIECWVERKEVEEDEYLWLPRFAIRFKNHPDKYAYVTPFEEDEGRN